MHTATATHLNSAMYRSVEPRHAPPSQTVHGRVVVEGEGWAGDAAGWRGVWFERVDHEEGSVLGGQSVCVIAHLSEYAVGGKCKLCCLRVVSVARWKAYSRQCGDEMTTRCLLSRRHLSDTVYNRPSQRWWLC
jgi:hypothetical protein